MLLVSYKKSIITIALRDHKQRPFFVWSLNRSVKFDCIVLIFNLSQRELYIAM